LKRKSFASGVAMQQKNRVGDGRLSYSFAA
jgi:hypothetical protein